MTNYNTLLWFPLGTKLELVRLGALLLVLLGASSNLTDFEITLLAWLLLSQRMLGSWLLLLAAGLPLPGPGSLVGTTPII